MTRLSNPQLIDKLNPCHLRSWQLPYKERQRQRQNLQLLPFPHPPPLDSKAEENIIDANETGYDVEVADTEATAALLKSS